MLVRGRACIQEIEVPTGAIINKVRFNAGLGVIYLALWMCGMHT